MITRRSLTTLAATMMLAGLAACGGKATPVADAEELFYGKADAPVTIVEYASVACPVCAQWQKDVLPEFKKKYIDTGQVKLVTRELNAHNPAFSTAGFLVARCAGKEKYHAVVDAIYRDQQAIEASGDYRGGLLKIAKANGLSEKAFDQCVSDPVAIEAQNVRVDKFAKQDNVSSTPTFVVDGRIAGVGFQPMDAMDSIVASAKAAKGG